MININVFSEEKGWAKKIKKKKIIFLKKFVTLFQKNISLAKEK